LDDQGRPKLKPGTLLDLRNILGPLLQEELKYIYVPRLASDDENLTWVLDNVMLKGEDVMPDKITIENYNMVVMSPTSSKATDQAMGATLRIHMYVQDQDEKIYSFLKISVPLALASVRTCTTSAWRTRSRRSFAWRMSSRSTPT